MGLAGLAVTLVVNPEYANSLGAPSEGKPKAAAPQLPKVAVTASAEELRAAFEAAERLGKTEAGGDGSSGSGGRS